MFINEIQFKKDLDNVMSMSGLSSILQKNGWKELGTGEYGVVAERPNTPYVLKVFVTQNRYLDFVKFCENHTGNPHIPNFNKTAKEIPGTPFSYVRMEKLQPNSPIDYTTKFLPEMCAFFSILHKQGIRGAAGLKGEIVHALQTNKKTHLWANLIDSDLPKIYNTIGRSPSSQWIEITNALCEAAKSLGLKKLDSHSGNFMRRNETVVITDPFA